MQTWTRLFSVVGLLGVVATFQLPGTTGRRRPAQQLQPATARNGRCRTRTRQRPATAHSREPGGVVKDLRSRGPSTGVLRAEGGPVVVGNTIFEHALSEHRLHSTHRRRRARRSVIHRSRIPTWFLSPAHDTVNRGVAYADGKIFSTSSTPPRWLLTQTRARSVAGETGRLQSRPDGHLGAALVIKGKVISRISGGEFGARGFIRRKRRQHGQADLACSPGSGRRRLPWFGRNVEGH